MLKINNLHFSVPERNILENISFYCEAGKIAGIIGPSGSGKSTILRLVSGLLKPTEGQIIFENVPLNQIPVTKRPISYLQQSFPLYNQLSVIENLLIGYKNILKVKDYLNYFSIREDIWNKPPNFLSGGEKQRIALAKALLKPAKLLLLDEPLSNLDKSLKNHISSIIIDHVKRNNIVSLYVTHDENEIIINSDNLIVLEEGKLIQKGTIEDILKNPFNSNIASLGNPLGLQIVDISILDFEIKDFTDETKKLAWQIHTSTLSLYQKNNTNDIILPVRVHHIKKINNKNLYTLLILYKEKSEKDLIWYESKNIIPDLKLNQKAFLSIKKDNIIKLDNNNKVIQ